MPLAFRNVQLASKSRQMHFSLRYFCWFFFFFFLDDVAKKKFSYDLLVFFFSAAKLQGAEGVFARMRTEFMIIMQCRRVCIFYAYTIST